MDSNIPERTQKISAILLPWLPHLLKIDDKAAETADRHADSKKREQAWALWAILRPQIEARPAALEAARDAATHPQDEDARAALRRQLRKLLEEDAALTQEIARVMTQIAAGERSVAAQTIQGSNVFTGDRNALFTGPVYQIPPGGTFPHDSVKPANSLPPRAFFVGRVNELATIAQALSPDTRTWGVLIDGPGGIGKTALAIEAAHRAPADLFERKIFITAKVRELTPEGERPLTDFTRLNYLAMLNELALALGEDNIPTKTPEERPNALRLALTGKKALIIFDNLETLPEEDRTRLFQFLARLPEGNKAIVTSRRRTDVDARIIRLDRLSRDEALQLIANLAERNPHLARASQKERADLYEHTQGNPLLIQWIAGQLGHPGSRCRTIADACAFLDRAPRGNDPLEYIFGDLLTTCTDHETVVLAALTHFNQPAHLEWIVQMTKLPERAAETALEDLTNRSILIADHTSQTWVLPPLTAKFIRTRRPESVAQTGDALVNHAYALVMQYGGYDNYDGFRTLDAKWHFLEAALPRLIEGDNARLQTVCDRIGQFLLFYGHWDEGLWLAERAEQRALAADDKENAGWRAYDAGWMFHLREQPDQVLACADRAAEHWQESTLRNKAIAIRLRGIGHQLKRDYAAAAAAYRQALDMYRAISPESDDVAITLNDLAVVERLNGDYPAAERDYREALRIAKEINYLEGVATYTGNLAALALNRQQWAEAETLARDALALAEKVGRLDLIAADCHRIAQALLRQRKNLAEARDFARRAVEIHTRLRTPDVHYAQATLTEIEQAIDRS